MRLLHVISSVDPKQGGTSEALLQLSREAIRAGHQITIATIDDPKADWLTQFPLPIHALGPGRTAYQYSSKLQEWLKENVGGFEAVISHGLWQFTGVAVRRACLGKVPYFVFPHGMLDPYFNQFLLKKWKKTMLWPFTDYRVLRDARAVFFTSEEERLGARRSFSPYSAAEVVTPLGIENPPPFSAQMQQAFREKIAGLAGRRYLLFLGRIHPKKGCDLLLRAWSSIASRHPELSLVIAGPDPSGWREELQLLADERVFWPGMLTGDAKWGALYGAEAFLLPSHQENFGIAVAESLACGTPVLISNKVNIWREIVEAGGGLVGADTAEETEDLMSRFLLLNEQQKDSFRLAAQRCFENYFRLSSAAKMLHRRIEDLVKNRRNERSTDRSTIL